MKYFLCGVIAMVATCSWGVESASMELEDLRLQKRFGIGVSAAGPLSMFGIEADVNLTESFSVSAGIGTGLHYSTVMVKGRWFLLGEWVSPYLALGAARWWTDGTQTEDISPAVLKNKFLAPDHDLSKGFSVVLMSPTIGVQFMHPMGLGFFAEIQYLIKLFDFSNGTYAGMGMHWYL